MDNWPRDLLTWTVTFHTFFSRTDRSCPLYTGLGLLSLLGPCGISVSFRHNYFSVFFSALSIQNNAKVVLRFTTIVLWSDAEITHCALLGLIPGRARLFKGAKTFVMLGGCTERREPCLGVVLRRPN